MSAKALAEKMETHINAKNFPKSKGLTVEEASRRLDVYGPNSITEKVIVLCLYVYVCTYREHSIHK